MRTYSPLTHDHLAQVYGFVLECEDEQPFSRRAEGVPSFATPRGGVYQMPLVGDDAWWACVCADEEAALVARLDGEGGEEEEVEEEEGVKGEEDGAVSCARFEPFETAVVSRGRAWTWERAEAEAKLEESAARAVGAEPGEDFAPRIGMGRRRVAHGRGRVMAAPVRPG